MGAVWRGQGGVVRFGQILDVSEGTFMGNIALQKFSEKKKIILMENDLQKKKLSVHSIHIFAMLNVYKINNQN